MKYSIEELKTKKEDQLFDRKSARKDPKGLSNHIIAFANADGGTLVIGMEDNGEITGIDDYAQNVNEILRVPFDFCKPSVLVETETLDCMDASGKPNHLLLIKIPQSPELHANQQDDVYYRMGDKSQKLSFDDRLRLMYSKGSRYYEDEPVADSSIDDIDMDFVASYCRKIGYTKSPEEYIRQNKSFIVTKSGHPEMSGAAILLFGKDPQQFFQRFVWKEIIINAAAHRDYSIKGTDIQIKMFDDRLVVESPGNLPGIVRLNNMRQVHFSRNPKIAAFLHEYDYVQEFGEGVDRMYREMENAGLPAPEYRDVAFMLNATIRNGLGASGATSGASGTGGATSDTKNSDLSAPMNLSDNERLVYEFIKSNPESSTRTIADNISLSLRTIQRCVSVLREKGIIANKGTRQRVKWITLK